MNNNDEIIRLLKHGRGEEARSFINAQKKENYPEDFSMFMERMLKEYHVKRKDIAIRSGLSQDYTYKLLRGTKKTRERDYILAICIAIGMNIPQTQHALAIYGMPTLNRLDLRSNVIYLGIENHLNIDGINEWLENTGFVYIKTNPDMPSAEIVLRNPEVLSDNDAGMQFQSSNKADAEKDNDDTINGYEDIHQGKLSKQHKYREINREIQAEHCGNAPMDYNYWGIITVQDEDGRKYYVEAAYTMDGDNLIVLDEENYKKSLEEMQMNNEAAEKFYSRHPEATDNPNIIYTDNDLLKEYIELLENHIDSVNVKEEYSSLAEAGKSEFFTFFLELDRATDDKVSETMAFIDDTRNYGVRIGAGFHGGRKMCYLEAFNTNNPAEREYLQIVQINGEYTFTASRESYFMRIELDDMYSVYFGNKREPEYYINVKNTMDLDGENIRLRFIFDDLLLTMHQYAKDAFDGLFDVDDMDMSQEMVRALIQRATWLMQGNRLEESIDLLWQSVSIMKDIEKEGEDWSIPLIVTYNKIAITYGNMGDTEKMLDTYEKIYGMKERMSKILEENSEGREDALWSMAESMVHKSQKCQNMRGQYDSEAKEVIKEAIDLLEGRCTYRSTWVTLFMAYTKYAYMIDIDDPELSVRYCHKAVNIVNAYHLDNDEMYQNLVYILYNNYAWVLWNELGSEEAIIYYGRAIEFLESMLLLEKKDDIKIKLAKTGEELLKIYEETGKEKEAQRLRNRLQEDSVDIN